MPTVLISVPLNPLCSLSSSLLGTRGIHPTDPGTTDPYQSLPQAAASALAQGWKKGKLDPLTGPTLALITAHVFHKLMHTWTVQHLFWSFLTNILCWWWACWIVKLSPTHPSVWSLLRLIHVKMTSPIPWTPWTTLLQFEPDESNPTTLEENIY